MLHHLLIAVLALAQGATASPHSPAAFAHLANPFVSLRSTAPRTLDRQISPLEPPRRHRLPSCALTSLQAVATGAAPNGVANKVALVALGCPKNTVDAEVMLGDLQKKGFKIVRQPRDADVVIVNTCTFVEVSSIIFPLPCLKAQTISTHLLQIHSVNMHRFSSLFYPSIPSSLPPSVAVDHGVCVCVCACIC